MNLPADVANEALDSALVDFSISDMEEGTRAAQVCLRHYSQCLRQLLRGAPWDFARRESPLTLLADATGQTANVGSNVPSGFRYEYSYPIDCARVRYIPWRQDVSQATPPGNIAPVDPTAPLMTGLGQGIVCGGRPRPARFLITNDPNYPPPQNAPWWEVQGVSPEGRTVILTDVQMAHCVYTTIVLYPSVWDPLFRAAMVAYLASMIAAPLAKDKKLGLSIQDRQIGIAKQKIMEARIADGNEMWSSSDLRVDWMDFRYAGRGGPFNNMNGGAGDFGCFGGGWAGSIGFANGSAY